MEQSLSLNKIAFYGNKRLINGHVKKVKSILNTIIKDNKYLLNTLEINFVSDSEILKINNESLNHNYYTDIITFDYTLGKTITGDIYISIEQIKENAKKFENSSFHELLRVMCHGVLHLCGYKDKSKINKVEMTKMENKYLMLYKKFHVEH